MLNDMRRHQPTLGRSLVNHLSGWMIAERPAVVVMMKHKGLLLSETGMHMVMMGLNLGKQLMDLVALQSPWTRLTIC